jgi:hypothetical protein
VNHTFAQDQSKNVSRFRSNRKTDAEFAVAIGNVSRNNAMEAHDGQEYGA